MPNATTAAPSSSERRALVAERRRIAAQVHRYPGRIDLGIARARFAEIERRLAGGAK